VTQQEIKKGDRVKINDRSTTHVGDSGTVTMISGGQYWVKLDNTDELLPALQPWWLEIIS
jgi:hypothetical protein